MFVWLGLTRTTCLTDQQAPWDMWRNPWRGKIDPSNVTSPPAVAVLTRPETGSHHIKQRRKQSSRNAYFCSFLADLSTFER